MPCMLMRGGTSKGAYFRAEDLPADPAERNALLLRIMGSPDPRQIDGLGGAHPLTSKVAVVSVSPDPRADVDYLFLQVGVDQPDVSDAQNCGNLLAGVGPFAVERGLVPAQADETPVRIRMLNTGQYATARIRTAGRRVEYGGDTAVPGVPGTAAPVVLAFAAPDGTGTPVLPTGNTVDEPLPGVRATLVDAGMPVVLLAGEDFGVRGDETPEELESDEKLTSRIAAVRSAVMPLLGLDPAVATTVPKLTLLAPPRHGGTVSTRSFIPVRAHAAIGALAAVSVGTGLLLDGAVGARHARLPPAGQALVLEHPTGELAVSVELDRSGPIPRLLRSGVVRTARKIFDGTVYPGPAH
ncbi:4-oxalomesaconate tautomerase [Actinomadura rubteroloni]|uniref:4-oxalomesaconate tautomerase n=2 Tax=Actinomadura rubteroloni TaxID=1926885 RepID=A0A2P4UDQ1_9ACTN|nr:4-oxalomesaconate tautomerase [Actinomadura rubteroloni]